MDNYYTKEEVVRDGFLFISYKHEDANGTVNAVLEYLYDQGVRFWFDADLSVGQNWTEVARELIMHKNCLGVIFFNSIDSFTSEPVHKERGYAIEKTRVCKQTKAPFVVFPVNIGYPSVVEIIRAVFEKFKDGKQLNREFPLEYINNIATLFDSNIIYCYADPEKEDEYKKNLCDEIIKTFPHIVNKLHLQIRKENNKVADSIFFGQYKDKPTNDVPVSLLNNDGRISLRGSSFLVLEGVSYTIKDLSWRVLYCEGDRCILVCEDTVCIKNGGSDLKKWLSESFRSVAFSEEEQSLIEELRLVTEEDIHQVSDEKQFVFAKSETNSDGHWWIDSMSLGSLQKVMKKDGKVFSSGYNIRTKRSGVRPVIVLSKDNVLKMI